MTIHEIKPKSNKILLEFFNIFGLKDLGSTFNAKEIKEKSSCVD